MKKYIILLVALLYTNIVFAQAITSDEFQGLENPTAHDLLYVTKPTLDDFHKLSPDQQQLYIIMMPKPNSEFTVDYLTTQASFRDAKDQLIAQRYFAEDVNNINQHKDIFEKYMGGKGVSISVAGDVTGFDVKGNLQGKNQVINIEIFKNSPAKDNYNIFVAPDGGISLIPKGSKEQVEFTGELKTAATGRFSLKSGTINGKEIENGYQLTFDNFGEISGGSVTVYNGIQFTESTAIKTTRDGQIGQILQVNNANIISVDEDTVMYIHGSTTIEDYDAVEGKLIVPKGKKLTINNVEVSATTENVEVRIAEPGWFQSAKEVFAEKDDTTYVQLSDKELAANGEGVEVKLNAKEFVSGEKIEEEQWMKEIVNIDLREAKNQYSYKLGDKGENVAVIQRMLMSQIDPETRLPYLDATYTTNRGEFHSDDGVFGAMTDKAIKEWQKDNNLVVDGKFGKISLAQAQTHTLGNVIVSPSNKKIVLSTDGEDLIVDAQSSLFQVSGRTLILDNGAILVNTDIQPNGQLGVPIDLHVRNDVSGNVLDFTTISSDASTLDHGVGDNNYLTYTLNGETYLAYETLEEPLSSSVTRNTMLQRLKNIEITTYADEIVNNAYASAEERADEYHLSPYLSKKVAEMSIVIGVLESYWGEKTGISEVEAKLQRERIAAKIEEQTGLVPDTVSYGYLQLRSSNAKSNAEALNLNDYSGPEELQDNVAGSLKHGQRHIAKLTLKYSPYADSDEELVGMVAASYNAHDDAAMLAAIQSQLYDLGYKTYINGLYTYYTREALRQFSEDYDVDLGEPMEEGIDKSPIFSKVRQLWSQQHQGQEAPYAIIPPQNEYANKAIKYCYKLMKTCNNPIA